MQELYVASRAQKFQNVRLDNRRRWKRRRAESGWRRKKASDSEQSIGDEPSAPTVERNEGPRKCLAKGRSWFARARHARRALRGKLSGGNEVNNGTGGQIYSFSLANPVASIRLEELLVRGARWNPVRTNRCQRGGAGGKQSCQLSRRNTRAANTRNAKGPPS